jgi:hypothetical protein
VGIWKLAVITCAQQHQHSASEGVPGGLDDCCGEERLICSWNAKTLAFPSSHPGTKIQTNAPLNRTRARKRFQECNSSICIGSLVYAFARVNSLLSAIPRGRTQITHYFPGAEPRSKGVPVKRGKSEMVSRPGFVKMAGFQLADWPTSQLIRRRKYSKVHWP